MGHSGQAPSSPDGSPIPTTGVPIMGSDGVNAQNIKTDTDGNLLGGGLGGASTNGTIQLTAVNTWVQVPTVVPVNAYVLVVTKENEAGTIRWSFENGGVPSATNGNTMFNDDIIFNLAASEVVFFGSTDAGDDVNFATKII